MTKLTNIERLSNLEVEIKNVNRNLEKHVVEQREDFQIVFAKLDKLAESVDIKLKSKADIETVKQLRDEFIKKEDRSFSWKLALPGIIIAACALLITLLNL